MELFWYDWGEEELISFLEVAEEVDIFLQHLAHNSLEIYVKEQEEEEVVVVVESF